MLRKRRRDGMSPKKKKAATKWIETGIWCLVLFYLGVTCLTYNFLSGLENNPEAISDADKDNLRELVSTPQVDVNSPIYKLQHTFPIKIGDEDMETIDHPGLALLDSIPRAVTQLGISGNITVPKFFDNTAGAAYGGSIRTYLHDGDRLPSVEEAKSIGSYLLKDGQFLETIYISIASYRDPDCPLTLEDLYERAVHPERLRVAIIEQRIDDEDDPVCTKPPQPCSVDPNHALCKYAHLIDYYEMDARLAVGPVFARHLGHRYYRGEYFAMQVDSHVRFVERWEETLIRYWQTARNEMAVLSVYLSDLNGSIDPKTHKGIRPNRPIMCKTDFEGHGDNMHLRHGQQPETRPQILGEPTLHPFWAAGFSFARGHFVIQVPYDQYLPQIFQGEEISIGLRGFTYGYDYYTPENNVVFHMYAMKANKAKRKKIHKFWENDFYEGVGTRAMRRLNAIIGMVRKFNDDEWQQDEKEKYGLGKIRQKEKYFKVFGIHVDTNTVENHLCRFVGRQMMKKFMKHMREDRMGLDYDKIKFEFVDPDPSSKDDLE